MDKPMKRLARGSLTTSRLRTERPKSAVGGGVQVATLVDATGSFIPYIDAVREHTKNMFVRLATRYPGIGLSLIHI